MQRKDSSTGVLVKIGKFVLDNVTSYEHRTEFNFDTGLNIFIGPNGGGKSNLQKTLAIVLTHYFVHQWSFAQDEEQPTIQQTQTYKKAQLRTLLSTYGNNERSQSIEIELIPESHDLANIRTIGQNLDALNKTLLPFERPFTKFTPFELLSEIQAESSFHYRIADREIEIPGSDTGAFGFLKYLNEFFIYLRFASRVPDLILSAPIFFFTSERALTKGFEIQAGHLTEDTYISGYQGAFNAATGQTNLLQWGAQHFVRLHRRSLSKAGELRTAHFRDFLAQEEDVVLLEKYLGKLGYGWKIEHDPEQTKFRLGLTRGDFVFFSEVFSSGEREIIHFLVAMFALNVRDGLILVDEPELHLHPRWQRLFLRLFKDLAPERNNQFIIATHSPVFVSPDTIQNVARVYRAPNEGSHHVALKNMDDLPSQKQLVRMINSQNNERLFFADKVILVEGITDRIVIGSLVELAIEHFTDNRSIEVIDVGGKHNISEYTKLLDAMKTPWGVIADCDYLEQIGKSDVKKLFRIDHVSQTKSILDDKRSQDRLTLIQQLREHIESGEQDQILSFLDYLDTRHQKLRQDLSSDEQLLLEQEISRLKTEGVELLKHGGGEIEDYLPIRSKDIGTVVEMVTDSDWLVKVPNVEARSYLAQIICRLLNVESTRSNEFENMIRQGTDPFARPISENQPGLFQAD